jgi:flagellar basal body rod protein FlgB
MAIFNAPLNVLIKSRLNWLNGRSSVISQNIARADIKGVFRKEIKSFRQLLSEKGKIVLNPQTGEPEFQVVSVEDRDIKETKYEIEREFEVLEMNHNVIEQEALISLIKDLQSLYKMSVTRQ